MAIKKIDKKIGKKISAAMKVACPYRPCLDFAVWDDFVVRKAMQKTRMLLMNCAEDIDMGSETIDIDQKLIPMSLLLL